MNRDELVRKLEFVNQHLVDLQIIVYAIVGENNDVRKLDVDESYLCEIRDLFIRSINGILITDNNYVVLPISTADERVNCYYEYDLELSNELQDIPNVVGNDRIPIFNPGVESIRDISALVILIDQDPENSLLLYKKMTPVEKIIGNGKFLIWNDNRFKKFTDNLLRISPSFQIIFIGDKVIVIDIRVLERYFGFKDVLQREASCSISVIDSIGIVSNIEILHDLIVEEPSFARKLIKAAKSSPVISKGISNQHIIHFTKNHPSLAGKIRYTEDESKIMLDTKVSKRLFIRMLNDDFLTSDLTSLYYESLAKDGVAEYESSVNGGVNVD